MAQDTHSQRTKKRGKRSQTGGLAAPTLSIFGDDPPTEPQRVVVERGEASGQAQHRGEQPMAAEQARAALAHEEPHLVVPQAEDVQGEIPPAHDNYARVDVFHEWLAAQPPDDLLGVRVTHLRELKAKVALLIELAASERWVCTTCRAGAEWARELGVPYLDPGEYEAICLAAEQGRVWPNDAADWHQKKSRNPGWKISEQVAGALPTLPPVGWSWGRLIWSLNARLVQVHLYD